MNALKCGLGLVLVGGLVLTASCGDSTNDPAMTSGASGGGAGAMIAGAASSSGAPGAGAGHVGGAGGGGGTGDGGGKNSAGALGGAGLGGWLNAAGGLSGAGGPGVNPADCPAAAPTTDEACSSLSNPRARCNYGGTSCRCAAPSEFPGAQSPAGGAGAAGAAASGPVWQCFAALVCPAALPVVGEACASAPGTCVYPGEGDCDCGSSGTWTCRLANPCPRLKPMHGSACTGSNFCSYESHSGCVCSANHWVCN